MTIIVRAVALIFFLFTFLSVVVCDYNNGSNDTAPRDVSPSDDSSTNDDGISSSSLDGGSSSDGGDTSAMSEDDEIVIPQILISSDDFSDGDALNDNTRGDIDNYSPQLNISNIFTNAGIASELVLVMHDSDGQDWIHWLVHDIPVPTSKDSLTIPQNVSDIQGVFGTGATEAYNSFHNTPGQGFYGLPSMGWAGTYATSGNWFT